MTFDTHQHFWSLANTYTHWPTPELGSIYRDFGPGDLRPRLEESGIGGTVLVQAAPSLAETEDLLRIAARTAFVAGVVGWIDFEDPAACDQLRRLAADPLLVGVRPMVQSIAQPGWLLQPRFAPVFPTLVELDIAFDGLVLAHQIDDLAELAARHPELRIVLDHAGKPPIASGDLSFWREAIVRLAARPNVWCKLSGLWTEAGADRSPAVTQSVVAHLIERFGTGRLMWGSDWPVVLMAGGYGEWFDHCRGLTAGLTSIERDGLFGDNGRRFYGLF